MIPFNENELNVKVWIKTKFFSIPLYNTPVTPREGFIAMLEKRPIWQITGAERVRFCPRIIPDAIARATVLEAETMPPEQGGGRDMFGIEWEYIPSAGGSMVRPGKPLLSDANEWYQKLKWPEVDAWDWAHSAQANSDYLKSDFFNTMWMFTGWYERLISFMDFEGAIMAMVDEDQQTAVKGLFDKLSDLYIDIISSCINAYPNLDCFCIHDDWGSQKETFFSPSVVTEMIVPAMRRVTDFIHSKGRYAELHSCGQLYKQVPNMIAAGWDIWDGQPMNDTVKIFDEYGDRITVGVMPQAFEPLAADIVTQRAAAADFIHRHYKPGSACMVNHNASPILTEAFCRELYRESRQNFK